MQILEMLDNLGKWIILKLISWKMHCGINYILSFRNEAFANGQTIVVTIKIMAFRNKKMWSVIYCNADTILDKE